MNEFTTRKKKSVALAKDEWNALKKYRAKFLTSVDCSEAIGIQRNPLDRVLELGRGADSTIKAIRLALSAIQQECETTKGLPLAQE